MTVPLVLALTTSLLAVPPAGAAAVRPGREKVWQPPNTPLPHTTSVAVKEPGRRGPILPPRPVPPRAAHPPAVPRLTRLTATARLATAPVRAGALPLWVAPGAKAKKDGGAPLVTAIRNDSRTARAAGVDGLLFSLTATTRNSTTVVGKGVQVTVGIDMAALQRATGGDFASRGRLVALPACAAATPEVPACRVGKPLTMHQDKATGRVTAEVTVPLATAPASAPTRTSYASPAPMLLAADTQDSGGGGDYKATALAPSSAWSTGGSSGALTYSYALQVPPALGGQAPALALDYDSSSVDGRTSATNAQASWIGDGWDLNPGFVERTYRPCDDAGIAGSGDLCWAGYNASLSLGQHSGQLVRVSSSAAATDAETGVWRLKNDDGTRVEFGSGAANGVQDGAYAKVTDPGGTVYWFGVNHLPGGDKTDTATDSVSSVPVYAPKSGDPCHDPAKGAGSWCRMWQRLSLDHVVDPHGNLTTYRWAPETNHYARGGGQNGGNGTLEPYTRATTLAQVSYGRRLDEQIAAKGTLEPAARVTFTTAERCADQSMCDPSQRTVANKGNWPDVPVDQECASGSTCTSFGPTYFTTRRLASVLTEVRTGGVWKAVDAYVLKHSFPDPKDTTSQKTLWLDSILRTGKAGSTDAPLPAVAFTPTMLPNRVDGTNLVPAPPRMNRPRIQQIANETGGVLNVDYDLPGCSRLNNVMPAAEDDNAKSCYPVRWTVPGAVIGSDPVLDWFNHYTVKSITENDTVTDAPQKITSYTYDKPGWHRDDSQFTDAKARTWGEFRGFATVTATTGSGGDGPKSQVRTTYHQGMNGDVRKDGSTRTAQFTDALGRTVTDHDWLAGRVLQTETFDQAGGTVTSHTVNSAAGEQETARQSRGTGLPDLVARYAATTTTAVASSKKADGTWWKTTKTTKTDKDHGNRPEWVLDQADGLPDLCTRSTYATAPDPQRTNLVAETVAVSGDLACTAAPVAANTVSRSRILYDGKPSGQSGAVGDPTGTQVLEKYGTDGTPEFTDTAFTTYDAYGRVTTATDPTSTDAQHPGGALTRTTYAPATGELPTTRTTAAPAPGQDPAVTWDTVTTLDPRRGLTLSERDPNGRTGTFVYDGLGRLTALWRPGRGPSTDPQADITYDYAVSQAARTPTAVTTSTLLSDVGTPVRTLSVSILDGFARERQTQATPPNPDYPGRVITDTVYDSQGRVRLSNAAWYNQDSGPVGTFAPAAESTIPTQTRTSYDGQGRQTAVATWSLGVEQSRTTTSYPGSDRTDTVPPAGSWPTSVVTDARGRTSARWQYRTSTVTGNPADATVSVYGYTVDGKPLTRKDAAGNTWSFGYDQRGRQISSTDPDAGTASQSYDTASRLVSSKDGRGTTLLRTYDLMGRQTGLYAGSVTAAQQLAGWTYDSVTGGKGKPASSTRYVGGAAGQAYASTVTGYDNAYRATGVKIGIPGSEIGQTGTFEYTVPRSFDKFTGKPRTAKMPPVGGLPYDDMVYYYDKYGEMYKYAGATTYDTQTDFDAFGRPIRSTVNPFGSQVVTTLDYDQGSGRLRNQYLDKQTSQNGAVQQTSYTYDKAGHLTSLTNTPDNTPANRDRECFTHDHLGRLTTAWTDTGALIPPGQGQTLDQGACANATPTSGAVAPALTTVGGGAPYWHEFSYDVTGNRKTFVNHDIAGDTTKDATTTQGFPAAGTVNNGAGAGGPHALGSTSTKTGTTTNNSGSTKYDGAGNPVNAYASKTSTTLMAWTPDNKLESHTPAIQITGIGGKCLDMQSGSSSAGTPAQIYTCNSGGGQRFSVAGSLLKVFNKCVTAMGTTAGSLVQLQSCDGSGAQTWTRRTDGTLYNAAAARCLAVPGDVTTNGTDLVVNDCAGTVPAGQKWTATDKITSYVYDAEGNTIVRRSPGKTVVSLGDTELVYDTVAKTLTGTRYYPVPGGLTSVRVGNGGLTVQLADHHGSGVLTIDLATTGLDETRRLMDPFGNPRGTQPAAGVWRGQKGFVGGTQDDGTGLTTLGARQYQPTTGRFLNPDPLIDADDPQQWNGYVYSNNNPLDGSDAGGLFCDGCSANNPDSVWNDHGPGCTNDACYYDDGEFAYDVLPPGKGEGDGADSRTHLNRGKHVGAYGSREADDFDRNAYLRLQMLKWDFSTALLSMSAQLTQHYLDNSGEDYVLAPDDVDDLLRASGVREPLDAYINSVYAELKDTQGRTSFDSLWMQDAAAGLQNPDWYLGLRNIEYRVSGTVEDGTMNYSVQVYKNYNFDDGESFMGVDFTPFAKLHEAGLAHEYDIVGTSTRQSFNGWDTEPGLVYVGGL
ncbi:ricin-type beta-trefoil lectin domain protein [Streptomyces vietnamensis]|uniref:ricin-type beta-trefoil lectin domain protein n=1 Tax=Streptomyces vietnamensis TaxID=362257 RepID=UPI0034145E7D